MGSKKTENQKNNILIVARKLFYENGYKDTYFEDIANACGISKSLITHYFKSKADLAHEVYIQYSNEHKNKVDYKVYKYYYKTNQRDYNLQVSTAVSLRCLYLMYLDDPKVARFNDERGDDKFEAFWPGNATKYQTHVRKYPLPINEQSDEISMIAWAAPIACHSVLFAYNHGYINSTKDEILDYAISLNFRLMHVSNERISEILSESKYLLKKISFKTKPYFRTE